MESSQQCEADSQREQIGQKYRHAEAQGEDEELHGEPNDHGSPEDKRHGAENCARRDEQDCRREPTSLWGINHASTLQVADQ